MTRSRSRSRKIRITESGSLAKNLFWGAVILAGFVGVLFLAYRVSRQLRPPEYEGKVIDKWAGYDHSQLGSFPYFRLLVENAGGQRSTVAVDQEIYDRVKVGMWIRKTTKGIELSSLTAMPPDVRKRLCPSVTAVLLVYRGYAPAQGAAPIFNRRAVTEGHSHVLTSGGEAVIES